MIQPRGRSACIILLLTAALLSGSAEAHLLNMTRVTVALAADASGELVVEIDLGQSLLDADAYWALAHNDDELVRTALLAPVLAQLQAGLHIRVDGTPLQRSFIDARFEATSLAAIRNSLTPQMATLRWRLPPSGGERLEVSLAPELTVPWPCLVRSDSDRRALPISRLLTQDLRSSGELPLQNTAGVVRADDPLLENIGVYSFLGLQHIVPLGLDHVLFVLGLFFVGGGVRQLLLLVSCFTLAHTLTLAASTLGVVALPQQVVEPLIAASIIYIGLEGLFDQSHAGHRSKRRTGFRYVIVFAFGLLHGLGFASVLTQIGLPEGRFLLALLSFNLGVELGQLLVLVAAFAVFGLLQRRTWYATCIATPAATLIAGVGLYWLLQRISA